MLKKILIKIFLLLILLISLNFIYSKWFYENDIQKHSEILNLVRAIPDDADIIYIGESSNTTFRADDIDKRPISDFIGDNYPDLNTYDITKPASHAGVYKVLLENLPKVKKVKTVVVTLNLRSFNAQWIYSNLETSLQKSLVLIKPYPPLYNRFLLSFKGYDIKSEKEREQEFKAKWKRDKFYMPYDFPFKNVVEWDSWMWSKGMNDKNGGIDKAQSELACHYIKAYGFQLDTVKNPRINDFNDIIKLAHQREWNLVFNLLAENTEKAEDLVGEDLIYMMNENAEKLTKYFTNRGVLVVNSLTQVESEQFIDTDWTTEHYAEKGRKIIAKNIAETLKVWHADSFKEAKYETSYQTDFFNDCDNGVIWGQMRTITSEHAYSGEKSSVTGDGSDFSITFEFPLKRIPDSLKNTINVELWLYQTSFNQEAKLVVQANGQEFSNYWNGYDLKHSLTELNKWMKFNTSIQIPDSIKQADLVKIYVYNPSPVKVYVDDFKVSIEN